MTLKIMSADEMAEHFARMERQIDALGERLAAVDGVPKVVYSREEAAQYLGISVPQVGVLAARGELARVKMGEGGRSRVVYRRADLDAFINARVQMIGPSDDEQLNT